MQNLFDKRAFDGVAFAGQVSQGGVAGSLGHAQLLNPAGSGVALMVRRVTLSVGAAGGVTIGRYDTALAMLGGNGVNLKFGGAAAKAELRRAAPAAAVAGQWFAVAQANLQFDWFATSPVLVFPGQGLVANTSVVAVSINATFHWEELPA